MCVCVLFELLNDDELLATSLVMHSLHCVLHTEDLQHPQRKINCSVNGRASVSVRRVCVD